MRTRSRGLEVLTLGTSPWAIAVAGSTLLNPFDAWATVTVDAALTDGLDDVVRACEDALREGARTVAGRKEHTAIWVAEPREESTCRSP
jgi:hypothetical protein